MFRGAYYNIGMSMKYNTMLTNNTMLKKYNVLLLLSCPSQKISHVRAHSIARYVTVARSLALQASSSRRQEMR